MSFEPSHTVPGTGLQTWPTPDPSQPEGPRLDAGLQVQVVERLGDWAKVACANGWEAWVNGSVLVSLSEPVYTPPPPTPAPAGPPAAPPGPSGPPTSAPAASSASDAFKNVVNAGAQYGVGPLAMGGAALLVLASFLDWYSVLGRIGLGGWDVPFFFLLTGGDSADGLKLGLVLLIVAALVFLPMITRKPATDNRIAIGTGVAGAALVALALIRVLTEDALSLAFGFFVGAAGAGLILYEALRKRA